LGEDLLSDLGALLGIQFHACAGLARLSLLALTLLTGSLLAPLRLLSRIPLLLTPGLIALTLSRGLIALTLLLLAPLWLGLFAAVLLTLTCGLVALFLTLSAPRLSLFTLLALALPGRAALPPTGFGRLALLSVMRSLRRLTAARHFLSGTVGNSCQQRR